MLKGTQTELIVILLPMGSTDHIAGRLQSGITHWDSEGGVPRQYGVGRIEVDESANAREYQDYQAYRAPWAVWAATHIGERWFTRFTRLHCTPGVAEECPDQDPQDRGKVPATKFDRTTTLEGLG